MAEFNIEKTLFQKIISLKLFPFLLLVLVLTFYFEYLSAYWVYKHNIWTGLPGVLLIPMLSVWSFISILPELSKKWPFVLLVIYVATFFGFIIYHVNVGNEFLKNEFLKYSVYTKATVIKKDVQYSLFNSDFKGLNIKYKTKDGVAYETSLELTASTYDRIEGFSKLPIIYSSRHPDMVRLDVKSYNANRPFGQ